MADVLHIPIHSDDPRLKRHIRHDPQSKNYRVDTSGLSIADVDWSMHIGTLNQGTVGKCTAEAATETLASDPFWSTLPATTQANLNDTFSDRFYSDEEVLNGAGPFPPNDRGSDGLTSAKIAKARGYISGYQHTFTVDDALKALQLGPGQWGTLWKSGMDDVNPAIGQAPYTGTTRGGHELCIYKIVARLEQLWFRQSWGKWGYMGQGVGWISFDDFAKSLADQGDVVFFTPLTQPAPTPTPAPVDPDATFVRTATACTRRSKPFKTWAAAKGYDVPRGVQWWRR